MQDFERESINRFTEQLLETVGLKGKLLEKKCKKIGVSYPTILRRRKMLEKAGYNILALKSGYGKNLGKGKWQKDNAFVTLAHQDMSREELRKKCFAYGFPLAVMDRLRRQFKRQSPL